MSPMVYDLTKLDKMTIGEKVFTIRRDLEFAMPPRGLTSHRAMIAGTVWTRLTWRCPVDGCWFVCTPRSKENLEEIQKSHVTTGTNSCPSAPRRESLPSGLPEIEKLWREIDDVIEALMSETPFRDMNPEQLKAYAQGLSFAIIIKEKPVFSSGREVSKEGVARWKMRHGKLDYRPTPSRHVADYGPLTPTGGWKPETPPTPPARKAAPRRASIPTIPADKLAVIRIGLESGMFTAVELASTYGVSVEAIRALGIAPK